MDVEITFKGITNNNIRTIGFPITKDNLIQELKNLGNEYLIIGITVNGKNINMEG